MSTELNLSERLVAMGIDTATLADLRELRPFVAAHIDSAIEAAYGRILQFPVVQQVYRNLSMDDAKRAQRQHWLDDVFAGSFTEVELARSVDMVERRQKAGLSMRWYFVFWTAIFVRLLEAIGKAYRKRPDQLARMLTAAGKAVLFDIEIFTAVYSAAAERAAAAELHEHADGFEREVSGLVKSLAASTTELHSTAQAMSAVAQRATGQARDAMAAGEETAGGADTVATTAVQLTGSVQDIAQRVAQSTRIAATAVDEAQRTDALVRGLVEAGSRIGDVVKLIKDIASQTNLLAPN